METNFAKKRRKYPLSEKQLDLIIGSLLGDGHLAKTTAGYAFRVNHGLAQKEYVLWKYQLLKDLVRSAPKQSSRSFFFRTITHQKFDQLYDQFYKSGQKQLLDFEFLASKLNPFILAVWIMDDGSRDWNSIRLNSQSFSLKENQTLQKLLQAKLGIDSSLNRDKDRYRIRISKNSVNKVIEIAKPHIIPSMLYKLPL